MITKVTDVVQQDSFYITVSFSSKINSYSFMRLLSTIRFSTVSRGSSILLVKLFHLTLLGVLMVSSVSAQVSGTVFRDFNANGVQTATAPIEPGLTGYTVTAYNSAGTSLGTGTVNASGVYSFTSGVIASGTKVRLEFTLPTGYYASNGSASNSTVQFVTAGAGVTANLGVNIPADYCQSTNPTYALPCYVGNAYNGSGKSHHCTGCHC